MDGEEFRKKYLTENNQISLSQNLTLDDESVEENASPFKSILKKSSFANEDDMTERKEKKRVTFNPVVDYREPDKPKKITLRSKTPLPNLDNSPRVYLPT